MTETSAERPYQQRMELNDVLARAETETTQHLRDAVGALPVRYAWCWSHGALHCFPTGEEPWCTATWSWLAGETESEALDVKQQRFGESKFLHQLPDVDQHDIIETRREDR